jgi:phage-related minor tail protein
MTNDTEIRIGANVSEADAGLGQLSDLFKALGPTVAGFASGAVVAITGFAIAVGATAVKSAMELDSAVKNLGKQTGASGKEMAQYKGIIKSLYVQGLGEDFSELAENIAEVKKQTKLSGKELESFTRDATAFGSAFDTDISESTRSAKMIMDQFGVSSKEAFNLMTQGMQKGLNKNDDLLDSINEYSVHFQQLGFSADDMFNVLANGAAKGAFSVDKVGDAIKEFGIRSKDGSKASSEAFKTLSLNADEMTKAFSEGGIKSQQATGLVIKKLSDMKDKTKQNTAGVALFGTMWEDLGPKVIGQLNNIAGEYDKTKNSADKLMSMDYKSIGDAFEGLKRQIEVGFLEPLGSALLPIVNLVAGIAKKALPPLIKIFKRVGNIIKAAFAPEIQKTIKALSYQIGTLGIKGSLLKKLEPIFNAIKDAIGPVAKAWGDTARAFINEIPGIVANLKTIAPVVGALLMGLIEATGFINTTFATAMGYLAPVVAGAFTAIKTIILGAMMYIKGVIEILSTIKAFWAFMWKSIKATVVAIWTGIKKTVSSIFSAISSFIRGQINYIKTYIFVRWAAIKTFFASTLQTIRSTVSRIFSSIVSTIRSKISGAKSAVSSALTGIKNIFSSGLKNAYTWGKNLLTSFSKGVKAKIASLKKIVRNAVYAIKNLLGFGSPTKEGPGRSAGKWAPNLMDMYIGGIKDNIPGLKKVAIQAVVGVKDGLNYMPRINTNNTNVGPKNVDINALVLNDQTVNILTQRISRILTRGGI